MGFWVVLDPLWWRSCYPRAPPVLPPCPPRAPLVPPPVHPPCWGGSEGGGNPKFEARNPKQIRNPKDRNEEGWETGRVVKKKCRDLSGLVGFWGMGRIPRRGKPVRGRVGAREGSRGAGEGGYSLVKERVPGRAEAPRWGFYRLANNYVKRKWDFAADIRGLGGEGRGWRGGALKGGFQSDEGFERNEAISFKIE